MSLEASEARQKLEYGKIQ